MNILAAIMVLTAQDVDVDRLLKELDHEEIERRERATEALRRHKPDSLEIDRRLEAFAREATGESAKRADQIRKYRISARLLTDPERMMERLASPDVNVRRAAVQSLAPRGGAVAPLVRGHLKDADPGVQQFALQIVLAADNAEYLPDVRPFAEHQHLYAQALPWLAARGDPAAGPPLRAQVERGSTWAVDHLARLRQIEDLRLFRGVINDIPQAAPHVLRSLRGWPEARKGLAKEIRLLALEGMAEAILLQAETPDPEFLAAIKNSRFREAAAPNFALAASGDRDSIPFLMRFVRLRTLHGAIGMLGRLRAREAVWLFRKMLNDPRTVPEARDRAAYARAAGEIGGVDAEDLLLGLIEDSAEEVRFEAAASLGRLKCRRALAPLVTLLDDAVAFPRSIPPGPEASLIDHYDGRASGTESRQTREAAAGALAAITGEARSGSLDDRCAAWRLWWEGQQNR